MSKKRRGSALYFNAPTRNFAQGSQLQIALNHQAMFNVSTGTCEYHQSPVGDPTGVWLASYCVIDGGFTHLSIPRVVAELVS